MGSNWQAAGNWAETPRRRTAARRSFGPMAQGMRHLAQMLPMDDRRFSSRRGKLV